MAIKSSRLSQRLSAIKASPKVTAPPSIRRRSNRRAGERRGVYRFARLFLPDQSTINCIVRDISEHGARVVMEGAVALPQRLVLRIDQTAEHHAVNIAWQKECEVGLAFIS